MAHVYHAVAVKQINKEEEGYNPVKKRTFGQLHTR